MTSRYTQEARAAFKAIKCPVPGFILDIVEYKAYIGLRVYTENVDQLKTSQKVSVAEYLYLVRDTFKSMNVKCQFERVDGAPPKY